MELLLQFKKTFTAAVFESGALGYAVLTRSPTWRVHCAELADRAEVKPGHRVLDLGCGPGISAFGMLDRTADLDIVGLDLSRSMLFFAEHWRKSEPHGDRVQFVRADATQLPFPDQSFDAVTGHSFLYLLPEPDRVLAEVFRVLRPGGKCVFLEPNTDAPDKLIPPEIMQQATTDPRFVMAMAMWRVYSRSYGRFDEARFSSLFTGAGLSLVTCESTLASLGLFGIGERK